MPVLTFNGDPTEWTPFWESFESIIDKNTNHGDIDKCKYLQRSLTGDVAQTITGLPISSENYKVTMELLTKRFDYRQSIISRHIECLMALSKVSKENNLRGMRQSQVTPAQSPQLCNSLDLLQSEDLLQSDDLLQSENLLQSDDVHIK